MNVFKVDLYQEAGRVIRDFMDKTYYSDCIFKCKISRDGSCWYDIVCYVDYDINENAIYFGYDWWEGEKYIKDIKVCHIHDVIFPDEVKE